MADDFLYIVKWLIVESVEYGYILCIIMIII